MAEEKKIGEITHYYTKIGVGIVKLSAELTLGENIHVKGHTTDFTEKVNSMQIKHDQIEKAKSKDEIGIKTKEPVREGDEVFKVVE